MARLKDLKSLFSLKVELHGWAHTMHFFWQPLMTALDPWAKVGWSFGDNGSTCQPIRSHVAPNKPSVMRWGVVCLFAPWWARFGWPTASTVWQFGPLSHSIFCLFLDPLTSGGVQGSPDQPPRAPPVRPTLVACEIVILGDHQLGCPWDSEGAKFRQY